MTPPPSPALRATRRYTSLIRRCSVTSVYIDGAPNGHGYARGRTPYGHPLWTEWGFRRNYPIVWGTLWTQSLMQSMPTSSWTTRRGHWPRDVRMRADFCANLQFYVRHTSHPQVSQGTVGPCAIDGAQPSRSQRPCFSRRPDIISSCRSFIYNNQSSRLAQSTPDLNAKPRLRSAHKHRAHNSYGTTCKLEDVNVHPTNNHSSVIPRISVTLHAPSTARSAEQAIHRRKPGCMPNPHTRRLR